MSTTAEKRPSLNRKVTRTTEKQRRDALEAGIAIVLDGERYEVRMGDVTAEIARDLRRNTGMGFRALMAAMPQDPDIDLIAAFIWVARRVRGEVVEFDDVSFGYSDLLSDGFDVDVAHDDDDADGEIRPEV